MYLKFHETEKSKNRKGVTKIWMGERRRELYINNFLIKPQ
jgi:hypothetical protein